MCVFLLLGNKKELVMYHQWRSGRKRQERDWVREEEGEK